MKASSESGECASLISTGDFSVFEAVCRAGMGWIFLVVSWASFFPERRSAPKGRRRETGGKGRAHRWDLRGAGPVDFSNAKPSISAAKGQTDTTASEAGKNGGGRREYWEPARGSSLRRFL